MKKTEELLDNLALAFGGVSQIPMFVIGMAVAGQFKSVRLLTH